jgi:hypothetical protein
MRIWLQITVCRKIYEQSLSVGPFSAFEGDDEPGLQASGASQMAICPQCTPWQNKDKEHREIQNGSAMNLRFRTHATCAHDT